MRRWLTNCTAQVRPDTPPGRWFTDVWLTTNNPTLPRMRVPLTVEIERARRPQTLNVALGKVKAGTDAERKFVLRGDKPFRVTAITGTGAELEVRDAGSDSRAVHAMTLILHADNAGQFSRTIRVRTDMPNVGDFEIKTQAEVIP